MDGEQNGTQTQIEQQEQQATQQQANGQQETKEAQGKHAKGAEADGAAASGVNAKAYESQLAERDSRIEELEAQIAEAAKSAEAADGLRAEIAALKQQGEDERVEFALLLAGCRNVKAARAVLDDHGGDVDALKAAEPWMFAEAPAKATGKTGLPNAGAASDKDAQVKKWRAIAGLDDEKE
ncbi:MAG: hypothetical protein IJ087_02120 [Eggerthellaceae bacterium]|nr:hypothetical protein [Eggerthellaceae bacterium]